jgi:hypothetical protein
MLLNYSLPDLKMQTPGERPAQGEGHAELHWPVIRKSPMGFLLVEKPKGLISGVKKVGSSGSEF